jgi:hypothetical protein
MEDKKYCYSPRMVGKNEFKIKIDRFDKEDIDDEFYDGKYSDEDSKSSNYDDILD